MVDECPNVKVNVSVRLVELARKKLNLSPDMPANFVVDTALRDYAGLLSTETEVAVLEPGRQASPRST